MGSNESLRDLAEGIVDDLPELTAFLNSDPQPTFIIPIDLAKPIPFQIRFANVAFLKDEQIQSQIIAGDPASVAFRSWTQAIAHWRPIRDFGSRSWSAFTLRDKWKVVRMISTSTTTRLPRLPSPAFLPTDMDVWGLQREASMADAQLKSLRRMMEMSDVGVFEYDLTGTLIRGNESWYKLSNHPRDMTAHQDFSFMDLVYPEDAALVVSQWNKLLQKEPVTFEMRWKAPPHPSPTNPELMEEFQWVLSACVPVLDDAGELVSIAGNTIDISAQKRMQEVQRRRVEEALEAKRQAQNFIGTALSISIFLYVIRLKL
jgi:PAS domain-containing protein